jgi:hypothetical protein
MTIPFFKGELEVAGKLLPFHALGKDTELQRLWRHPDGDWNAAPAAYRNGRVDPPEAMRDRFGVLYLADSYITAAFETRVVAFSKNADGNEEFDVISDKPSPSGAMPPPLQVATHKTIGPVAFVDLEDPHIFGTFGIALKGPLVRFPRWRELSLAVYEFLEKNPNPAMPIVGVTYETQQNGSNGRNYGVFECYRNVALARGTSAVLDYDRMRKDVGAR